jgi:hypothetical protein
MKTDRSTGQFYKNGRKMLENKKTTERLVLIWIPLSNV